MQPITIRIEGNFYDSQIYAGYLHLWTLEGDLITIKWDEFIANLVSSKIQESLRFIAYAAFVDSNFFYRKEWQLLFLDEEFKRLFLTRLNQLKDVGLTFSLDDFSGYYIKRKNPFIFPHADSLIYYNTMYVCSRSGVYVSRLNSKMKRANKIWDGGVVNMSASKKIVALAAGQDGVHEYYLWDDTKVARTKKDRVKKQIDEPANFVNWMYGSLFSSFYSQGHIVQFKSEKKKHKNKEKKRKLYHEVDEKYSAPELFSDNLQSSSTQLIWGIHDKLCSANDEFINVVKYAPQVLNNTEQFNEIGKLQWRNLTSNSESEIIGASSGYFGYIIETDEGLLIIGSDYDKENSKAYLWLDEEPINWRLFANSKNYTNQLHVIYENNISIFSFNQDYYLNQATKLVGLSK